MLSSLFGLVQTLFDQTKLKMSELDAREKKLEKVIPDAVQTTDRVEQMVEKVEQQYKSLQEQVKKLESRHQRCLEWKRSDDYKEYKHYQARKQTPEYQDFLKWREGQHAKH
jgi:hypothetical protein